MNGRALLPVLLPLAVLLAWTALSGSGLAPAYLLPGPAAVFEAGVRYVFAAPGQGPYAGRFFTDLLASLGRVFAGFGLAALLGVPLGLCSGRVVTVNRLFASTIGGLRAVPGICWLPLALIWFGIGFLSKVILAFLMTVVVAAMSAYSGVRTADSALETLMISLGARRMQIFTRLIVPSAMPSIITGLRVNIALAMAGSIVGEFIASDRGLGRMIVYAGTTFDLKLVWVGVTVLSILSVLMYASVVLLEKVLMRHWRGTVTE